MTINRFRSIPSALYPNKLVDWESTINNDVGERIADDSYYVPNKEAVKIANKQKAESILTSTLFDSPEDIKSGSVNVYARQRGRDLAELTQQQRQLQAQAEKVIQKEVSKRASERAKADASIPTPTPAPAPTQPTE